MQLRDIYVGRQRELSDARAALDEAIHGRSQVCMLIGEPGIGKTRMVEELTPYFKEQDAIVMVGNCVEQGTLPYGPWIKVLRSYKDQTDADTFRAEMDFGAPRIAALLPEIRDITPDLDVAQDNKDVGATQERLHDSISYFFRNACRDKTLVLVLEDLHWADRSSLALMESLVKDLRDCRLFVVGTCRNVDITRTDLITQTLGRLPGISSLNRIELEGLSVDDVAKFIEAATGSAPSTGLVKEVYQRTEGSPLFVTEVVRLLFQLGILSEITKGRSHDTGGETNWRSKIPPNVRDAIRQRLSRLSSNCVDVLINAGLLNDEFTLGQLNYILEKVVSLHFSEEDLFKALDEAIEAGMLEEISSQIVGYKFTHTLIRATAAEEINLNRRIRRHRRIANALEEYYGDDADAHASELARHFFLARTQTEADKLMHYCNIAGNQALASYAHEEAERQFRRALRAHKDAPLDANAASLYLGLSRALVAMDSKQEAFLNLTSAFDYYESIGDFSQVVVVTEVSEALCGDSGVTELISRALHLVPQGSIERARVHSSYGLALYQEKGDYDGAKKNLEDALTISEAQNDLVLQAKIMVYFATIEAQHLNWDACLERSKKAIELAKAGSDYPYLLKGHYWAAHSCVVTGKLQEARDHASRARDLAEEIRDRNELVSSHSINEAISHVIGDWTNAEQYSNLGLDISDTDTDLLKSRTIREYELGNSRKGEEFLRRLLDLVDRPSEGPLTELEQTSLALVVAVLTTSTEIPEDYINKARAAVERISSSPNTIPINAMEARISLSLIEMHIGDTTNLMALYNTLKPYNGTMIFGGLLHLDRVLGMIARNMGKHNEALEHLQTAMDFCESTGYWPEYTRCAFELAKTLFEQGDQRRKTELTKLLEKVSSHAGDWGLRSLANRVEALKEEIENFDRQAREKGGRKKGNRYGLTAREVDVVRVLAKTDKEIAVILLMGASTVRTHITNILNKTGCSSRPEAIWFLYEDGFMDELKEDDAL